MPQESPSHASKHPEWKSFRIGLVQPEQTFAGLVDKYYAYWPCLENFITFHVTCLKFPCYFLIKICRAPGLWVNHSSVSAPSNTESGSISAFQIQHQQAAVRQCCGVMFNTAAKSPEITPELDKFRPEEARSQEPTSRFSAVKGLGEVLIDCPWYNICMDSGISTSGRPCLSASQYD